MELNTSADGDVIFVLPSVLVPRYGGDINNEPFFYKQEGKLHVVEDKLNIICSGHLIRRDQAVRVGILEYRSPTFDSQCCHLIET